MASQDWFEKDFYAILGVPQDADQAAIKKAYRKLARKHHPDQNAGDAASEKRFKDIGEANAVLSDPKQREEYDAIRQMAHGGARFRAGGPAVATAASRTSSPRSAAAGGQRVRFTTGGPGGAGAGQPDLDDLLAQMFGGAAAGGAGGARAAPTRSPGSAHRAARGPAPTCRPAPR